MKITLSNQLVLVTSLALAHLACGRASPVGGPGDHPVPTVSTATGGAIPSSAVPRNTVFEMDAYEALAGGPQDPNAPPPRVIVSAYRIEANSAGAGFVIVKIMSDGTRAGSVPVDGTTVAQLVELAKKHQPDLHCIDGVNRATFQTRHLVVSGPVNIDIRPDCQGSYADSSSGPAEHKRFQAGYGKLRDAISHVAEKAFGAKVD